MVLLWFHKNNTVVFKLVHVPLVVCEGL